MLRILTVLISLILSTGFLKTDQPPKEDPKQLIIHVKSSNMNQETDVKVAYMFIKKEAGELVTIKKTTPFTITGTSNSFMGLFQALDEDSKVFITVYERRPDRNKQIMAGYGSTVSLEELSGKSRIINMK